MYAVTPLLEDALIDRDLVHRQTACTVVKHMALGVVGLSCEVRRCGRWWCDVVNRPVLQDAIMHLINLVYPNIFETSPHVINAVTDAIAGARVCLGPVTMLYYVLQVCICIVRPTTSTNTEYHRGFSIPLGRCAMYIGSCTTPYTLDRRYVTSGRPLLRPSAHTISI